MNNRRGRKVDDEGLRKFAIGETVYHKDNTTIKLTVLRFSGKCYYCRAVNDTKEEIMCFEDDLISEWQIPFH